MARPKEVAAITDLLLAEHPDAETLAKAVIERLDQLRAERAVHVALVAAGEFTRAYGPFPTAHQARKALERGSVPLIEGERAGVVPVYPLPNLSPQKPGTGCRRCEHPAFAHSFPRVRGCVVGLPVNGKTPARNAPARCECEEFMA